MRRGGSSDSASLPADLGRGDALSVSDCNQSVATERLDEERGKERHKFRKFGASLFRGIKSAGKAIFSPKSNEQADTTAGTTTETPTTAGEEEPEKILHKNSDEIPDGYTLVPYTVQYGETLSGVAMKHNMSTAQFSKLNKLFGGTLFSGQIVYVLLPRDEALKRCGELSDLNSKADLQQERKSMLGGQIFDPIVLIDRKIQVGGSVDVNPLYFEFIPDRFLKSAVEMTSPKMKKHNESLLKNYAFRIDWRDIDGCTGGERRSLHTGKGSQGESSTSGSSAMGATLQKTSSREIAALEVEEAMQEHDYCMKVFWTCPDRGFSNPDPVTICCDSLDLCTSLVKQVQDYILLQREKSKRFEKLQQKEVDSITSGAIISGLLFKPNTHATASMDESSQEGAGVTSRFRGLSVTGVDLVQKALMNGEITEQEADQLRRKNVEVMEKMESLEQAHLVAAQQQVEEESSWRLPFASAVVQNASSTVPVAQVVHNLYQQRRVRVPPRFSGRASRIVESDEELTDINMELPEAFQTQRWEMLYDFLECGASLRSFYEKVEGHEETLLLVRTREGDRFGAFATEQWTPTRPREFYGTGECFVFTFKPDLRVFKWVGENDCFMSSSSTHLGMGAGGGGFAFCFDADLDRGSSSSSKTFGLVESLTREEDFRISELEVFGFNSAGRVRRGSGTHAQGSLFRTSS